MPYDTPYLNGDLVKRLPYSSMVSTVNNPLYEATLNNYEWSAYDEVVDNLSANWYLNDYLTLKGQFSITRQYTSSERFYDPLSSKVSVLGTKDSNLQGDLYTGMVAVFLGMPMLFYTIPAVSESIILTSLLVGKLPLLLQITLLPITVVSLPVSSVH